MLRRSRRNVEGKRRAALTHMHGKIGVARHPSPSCSCTRREENSNSNNNKPRQRRFGRGQEARDLRLEQGEVGGRPWVMPNWQQMGAPGLLFTSSAEFLTWFSKGRSPPQISRDARMEGGPRRPALTLTLPLPLPLPPSPPFSLRQGRGFSDFENRMDLREKAMLDNCGNSPSARVVARRDLSRFSRAGARSPPPTPDHERGAGEKGGGREGEGRGETFCARSRAHSPGPTVGKMDAGRRRSYAGFPMAARSEHQRHFPGARHCCATGGVG